MKKQQIFSGNYNPQIGSQSNVLDFAGEEIAFPKGISKNLEDYGKIVVDKNVKIKEIPDEKEVIIYKD